MTYISLATPLGPWIEPVFVMAAAVFAKFIFSLSDEKQRELLACVAAASGVAGIAAVGCAFSYPTLYFLEPALFNELLGQPTVFISTLVGIVCISGILAFAGVSLWEKSLLVRPDLTFPVAQLLSKLTTSQESASKGIQLALGSLLTCLFNLIQMTSRVIPSTVTLFKGYSYVLLEIPAFVLRADTSIMLTALGFVTGTMIAMPLTVGVMAKILLIGPLHKLIFVATNYEQMILAWCSGMVLYGAFLGIANAVKKGSLSIVLGSLKNKRWTFVEMTTLKTLFSGAAIFLSWYFFSKFGFSSRSFVCLLIAAGICTYQLILIAGKIGVAPLGRFATFVMLPGLILFHYTSVQVTLVTLFIELCGGIGVELMFGRKLLTLVPLSRKNIIRSQIIGLLVAAVTIGVIFWLLSSYSGLGIAPLMAPRGYARASLIKAPGFDFTIMACGVIFGWILHYFRVNSVLAISGLLMQPEYIIPLVLGGCISSLIKRREEYYPFWSGIFATASLFMIIKTLL